MVQGREEGVQEDQKIQSKILPGPDAPARGTETGAQDRERWALPLPDLLWDHHSIGVSPGLPHPPSSGTNKDVPILFPSSTGVLNNPMPAAVGDGAGGTPGGGVVGPLIPLPTCSWR